MNIPGTRMLPVLLAAAIVMVLLLTGCTGDGDGDDQTVAPSDGPGNALPRG